jgi:SET domain-containing protein
MSGKNHSGSRSHPPGQRSCIEVRSSRIEGRGVFAGCDLPARRKIGEIHGVLRMLPAARRQVEGRTRIYLIELSARTALDCTHGGPFRFLNHSCRPNCYLRVQRNRVEVYTLRRVDHGSELTVDYGVTPHLEGMECRCASPGCRRRL